MKQRKEAKQTKETYIPQSHRPKEKAAVNSIPYNFPVCIFEIDYIWIVCDWQPNVKLLVLWKITNILCSVPFKYSKHLKIIADVIWGHFQYAHPLEECYLYNFTVFSPSWKLLQPFIFKIATLFSDVACPPICTMETEYKKDKYQALKKAFYTSL